MQTMIQAHLLRQALHQKQRFQGILAPCIPSRKHVSFDFDIEFLGVLFDPLHVLGPNINRLVKNRNGIQFPDGSQRPA